MSEERKLSEEVLVEADFLEEIDIGKFALNLVQPGDLVLNYLVRDGRTEGNFAFVFDVYDMEKEEDIVLKTTALCTENFRNIGRAKANLREENRMLHLMNDCQNIVNSKGYMEYKGVGYLVLEKLPFSLEEAVAEVRDSGKPHAQIRAVLNPADSLARSLICMESYGIVNGDIAPMNFRAAEKDDTYVCKIIDFNGAYDQHKFYFIDQPRPHHRKKYSAPEAQEAFKRSRILDQFLLEPSLDMYSSGITLAATCLMAQGLDFEEMGSQYIHHRKDDESLLQDMEDKGVSVSFLSLINSMIKPNPDERIKPKEMLSAVRAIANLYGIPLEKKICSPDLSIVRKVPTFYQ